MKIKTAFFAITTLLSIGLAAVAAQEPVSNEMQPAMKPGEIRNNAIRQLGLSRDQLQQIRRLNMDRKPQMDAAQMRLREANQALDEAIYSDTVNEAEFQRRLRDFQAAQAEVARIRFAGEFGVRRVLTPDQLVRFRRLRQRFEDARQPGLVRRAEQDSMRPFRPVQRLDKKRPGN